MYFIGKRNTTYTSSQVRAMLNSSESDCDESDNDPTFKTEADDHGEPHGKDAYLKKISNKIMSITNKPYMSFMRTLPPADNHPQP